MFVLNLGLFLDRCFFATMVTEAGMVEARFIQLTSQLLWPWNFPSLTAHLGHSVPREKGACEVIQNLHHSRHSAPWDCEVWTCRSGPMRGRTPREPGTSQHQEPSVGDWAHKSGEEWHLGDRLRSEAGWRVKRKKVCESEGRLRTRSECSSLRGRLSVD